MQLIDPRLHLVNGVAQLAFEARLLVEAELPFFLHYSQKMRLVLLQRGAHRLYLARQIGFAGRNDFAAQYLDVSRGRLADIDLAIDLLHIIAKQEVLFRTPALQQLDLDPAVQFKDAPRVFRRIPVSGHRGFAVEVDAAGQNNPHHANDPDRRDLVG